MVLLLRIFFFATSLFATMLEFKRRRSVYYFAYGSNLNWPQMKARCPSSRFICVARLLDHQFGITRHSRLRNCGTANVIPAPGKEVWGALYEICNEDLVILDGFEDGYRRQILQVYALNNGHAR